jgi:hypothetical protein
MTDPQVLPVASTKSVSSEEADRRARESQGFTNTEDDRRAELNYRSGVPLNEADRHVREEANERRALRHSAQNPGKPILARDRFPNDATVVMVVPQAFQVTLDDGSLVRFEPGVQEVPSSLANNWYVKANGAYLYHDNPTAQEARQKDALDRESEETRLEDERLDNHARILSQAKIDKDNIDVKANAQKAQIDAEANQARAEVDAKSKAAITAASTKQQADAKARAADPNVNTADADARARAGDQNVTDARVRAGQVQPEANAKTAQNQADAVAESKTDAKNVADSRRQGR